MFNFFSLLAISREIKPVNLKGNQSWLFIGRTDAEAEAPILWPPDAKSQLIGKDPDAGKNWWKKKKRGQQRMRWSDSITLKDTVKDRGAWRAAVHGIARSRTKLGNWTTWRMSFFENCLFKSSAHFFDWALCFSDIELYELPVYFRHWSFVSCF